MRLIDANALITLMKKGWRLFPSSELRHTCDITDIENAPTIDAVPVVRCKDCRWYENDGYHTNCQIMRFCVEAEDYCSRGERKDDLISRQAAIDAEDDKWN